MVSSLVGMGLKSLSRGKISSDIYQGSFDCYVKADLGGRGQAMADTESCKETFKSPCLNDGGLGK